MVSTLIVVCCHAIYLGSSAPNPDAGENEVEDWLIEPFQSGETPTFIEHAQAGVQHLNDCLVNDEDAILVFSGGATKRSRACDKTEGQSYLDLCLARNFFDYETSPPILKSRVFAEEYATDSYQNILLSLIQYPCFRRAAQVTNISQVQGLWPQKLVIVSHDFKRSRFMDLHLPVMAFPVKDIVYVGIDPPFDEQQRKQVIEGDELRGYGAWLHDVRGTGKLLSDKRQARGWNEADFLRHCVVQDEHFSPEARTQLEALIKGESIASWPK